MRFGVVTLWILAFCTGCASMGESRPVPGYPAELIDGTILFGQTIEPAPEMALLDVSPAMVEFVDAAVDGGEFSYLRFRRLMSHMIETGFFINQYDRTATLSAAETFVARKGNCLAYTNLFIALARTAGLRARYQLIDGPPVWDVESGFLIRNNHVNVRVDGIRIPGMPSGELTVDFNDIDPDPHAPGRVVSDAYAASMFYANVAIEYLHAGEYEGTFAYLKRAALVEPNNTDVWNNLGALYSILENDRLAEQAYRVAMEIDNKDKTAITGLAKSLDEQGRSSEAKKFARLAERYQNRNAYYHYAVAEQAFRNDAFDKALAAINQAIELNRSNPRFYALRAATAHELGDESLAKISERLQRKHAKSAVMDSADRIFN